MANLNEKKKFHFIYKTTNLLNGKYYIGMHSTSNLNDGYIGSGKRLKYSVRKHGIGNFKCEILEFLLDRQSLTVRERELVTEDIIHDMMCMNISFGGLGGFQNEEHERKFRIAAKKSIKIASENGRLKQKWLWENDKVWHDRASSAAYIRFKGNQFWLGKHHTTETKQKMTDVRIERHLGFGELNSQYGSHWITNGITNKKIMKEQLIPDGWYIGRTVIKKMEINTSVV